MTGVEILHYLLLKIARIQKYICKCGGHICELAKINAAKTIGIA
jgi:hypothetical protein